MEHNYLPAELPIRAYKALYQYKGEDQVSVLLCLAWSVFVVPTERLDFLLNQNSPKPHHAMDKKFGGKTAYRLSREWDTKKSAKYEELNEQEGIYTCQMDLLPLAGSAEWFSKIYEGEFSSDNTFGEIVRVIRHSLSHGNVWTDAEDGAIKNLYFANYSPYKKDPVQVLCICNSQLLVLIDNFVAWYRKCVSSTDGREQISSVEMKSQDGFQS